MQNHQPIPKARLKEYAALEAAHPEAGKFEGGAPPNNLWIGIGLLCLVVIAIYTLFIEPSKVKPGM